MPSITIRNLDEKTKSRLRIRAATNDRSMEEEARVILRAAVADDSPPEDLAGALRKRFAPFGGVELELPDRDAIREPPDLEQ